MARPDARAREDDPSPDSPRPSRVEVLSSSAQPDVARLFHRGDSKAEAEAADLLRQALALLPEPHATAVLLTGAGLAWAELPGGTRRRYPSDEEHAEVVAIATRTAVALCRGLPEGRPVVVVGIDVFAWPHGSEEGWAVGQFAAVLAAGGRPPVIYPKRFPVAPTGEEAYLRVPNPDDQPPEPACDTSRGRAAVLVCHDLNVYHPRSVAVTTREERRAWRTALTEQVEAIGPAFGLHLAHLVGTPRSFAQGYGGWRASVGVPLFGAAGFPADVSHDRARELAASLTTGADGWTTLDLLERPAE